jgi:hypothetical protein
MWQADRNSVPIAGLLEVLQRRAAGWRDLAAVRDQAMGDPFTIGNELPANDLGVLHARLLIRLRIGLGGERRQTKTKPKHSECEYGANFHGYPQRCGYSFSQEQHLNLSLDRANQI